jgi:DNA recombination protein RmuC
VDTSVLVSAALVAAVLGVAIGALWARQRAAARELALTAENAKLAAQLETERAAAADKLATLEQNRERLTETFKALSSDALSRNAQQFLTLASTQLERFQLEAKQDLESRQKQIGETLNPIRESMQKVDEKIQALEKERVGAYSAVHKQLEQLMQDQQQLRGETSNLVSALRQPTVRGRWGEIQLRRVVELAGMLNYCDFFEQQSVDGEEGRLRPDLVIRLPGDRNVIVDSKVPLSGYLGALEARDEATRTLRLQEHAKAVKNHIRQLSAKNYAEEVRASAQFVVLFLPGEVFFSAALEQDPELIEAGVEQGVMIATPTSLIALLRAVHYGWRQEQIARNAAEISQLGKEIYERLNTLGEHWTKVGTGLRQAVDVYNRATGTLESRVMVTARRFRDLDAGLSADKLETLESVDVTPRQLQADELQRLPPA